MITLLLHISNSEPIKVDVDELPHPQDNVIVGKNARERNDKELDMLDEGVTTLIIPWWRINFVQVLPSPEDELEFELPYRD